MQTLSVCGVTLLPPLELALSQLWERCSDGYLTHRAYDAIGEVAGSLATWCNTALNIVFCRLAIIDRCVLIAPFGRPVVPLV